MMEIDTYRHRPKPCLRCEQPINRYRGYIVERKGSSGPKKTKLYACDPCISEHPMDVIRIAQELLGGSITWRR